MNSAPVVEIYKIQVHGHYSQRAVTNKHTQILSQKSSAPHPRTWPCSQARSRPSLHDIWLATWQPAPTISSPQTQVFVPRLIFPSLTFHVSSGVERREWRLVSLTSSSLAQFAREALQRRTCTPFSGLCFFSPHVTIDSIKRLHF